MVQFECPRVIYPLVPFNIGVHSGVSISLYVGKGNSCIWPVNKLEIHFAKMGFVDCKCSNLNAPGSYTSWSHSLLGSILDCPFLCMQEKRNAACGLIKSVTLLCKNRFHGLEMVQFECPSKRSASA